MGDANPFAPNPGLAFLTGLTSSTMGTFKQQHDDQQKEDARAKQIDYELLMAGLEQMKPNLTPGQAKEVLTRAVDIFKPKGHGGIKDRLHEMFGGHQPYEPQAGNILSDASSKPRLSIAQPTQTAIPGSDGGGVRARTVTMPPPPQSTPELTYREQELADKERLIDAQTTRQLAVQEARSNDQKEQIRLRNDAITVRHMNEFGIKDKAKATLALRTRASLYNPANPDDPEAMNLAAESLKGEINDKRDMSKSRIELNKRRLTEIDDKLKVAWARVDVAKTNAAAHAQAVKYKEDPQWKGMWSKASTDAAAAKLLRTQAAIAHSKFNTEGDEGLFKQATDLEGQAKQLEDDMQKQLDGMENREYTMSGGTKMGGVTLPGNPALSGTRGQRPWSASKWAAANPGKDVERAKVAAAARGDRVVP